MSAIALVTKPTAAQETRDSVVRRLKEALEMAERGEIDTAVMIFGCPGGLWIEKTSGTLKCSETIGRIEIVKQQFIAQYLAEERD